MSTTDICRPACLVGRQITRLEAVSCACLGLDWRRRKELGEITAARRSFRGLVIEYTNGKRSGQIVIPARAAMCPTRHIGLWWRGMCRTITVEIRSKEYQQFMDAFPPGSSVDIGSSQGRVASGRIAMVREGGDNIRLLLVRDGSPSDDCWISLPRPVVVADGVARWSRPHSAYPWQTINYRLYRSSAGSSSGRQPGATPSGATLRLVPPIEE